jgi:hypothetical protein
LKCGIDLSALPSGAVINTAVMEALIWTMVVKRREPYKKSYIDWDTEEHVTYTIDTQPIYVYTQYDCFKRCFKEV